MARPSCTASARRPARRSRRSSARRPAARAVFRLGQVWDAVEALDNRVPADVQTRMRLHSRRLVERGTRWLLEKPAAAAADRRNHRVLRRPGGARSGAVCRSCCAARTWSGTSRSWPS
ncbi:hypothetical protein [Streptomyces narbonensis]